MNQIESFLVKIKDGRKAVDVAEDAICRAYYEQSLNFKMASVSDLFDAKQRASFLNMAHMYLNRLRVLSDMRNQEEK